ncbi:MAG TPA: phosphatase PAP2 family protein [Trinickia sp.]|uniref:phosphatase PAP2 family protein n=1 Tax=Trinickia sp. TaxID=2571163 RepID=UPI002CBF4D9D|nr:phosphatase PAP2 family protein [Trinickia sp.]HVW52110.1 phosphatase PAP2 family protein [Trinickia sp.]
MEAVNQALFLQINASPTMPHWPIVMALVIAKELIFAAPLTLAGMWLASGDERREVALRATLVALLALGINLLIGMAWYHPRPFVIGLGQTLMPHAPDSSFPSDHVTVLSALTSTLLYNRQRLLGTLTLGIAIAVAWARVFVGVHYPIDVLGAGCVGWLAYVATVPLWRRAGTPLSRMSIVAYRKLLAGPIAHGWLRA